MCERMRVQGGTEKAAEQGQAASGPEKPKQAQSPKASRTGHPERGGEQEPEARRGTEGGKQKTWRDNRRGDTRYKRKAWLPERGLSEKAATTEMGCSSRGARAGRGVTPETLARGNEPTGQLKTDRGRAAEPAGTRAEPKKQKGRFQLHSGGRLQRPAALSWDF